MNHINLRGIDFLIDLMMDITYREGKKEGEIKELKQQAATIEKKNNDRSIKEQIDELRKQMIDLRRELTGMIDLRRDKASMHDRHTPRAMNSETHPKKRH